MKNEIVKDQQMVQQVEDKIIKDQRITQKNQSNKWVSEYSNYESMKAWHDVIVIYRIIG